VHVHALLLALLIGIPAVESLISTSPAEGHRPVANYR
jgi:hypothetical protein